MLKSLADLRGQGMRTPDQNFFIFMQFLGKIDDQLVGWCPQGLAPPLWEILDPPLSVIY